MNINMQTQRLLLRPLRAEDATGMFLLDSNNQVLQYLPENLMTSIEDARKKINHIQQQYITNGTGRLAVLHKEDETFLGWCGIKLVTEGYTHGRTGYYDIGYRFLPEYWNKGYAFEAAKACFDYAFTVMNLGELNATVMEGNVASARIAEKLGMHLDCSFIEDGRQWLWYRLANPYAVKQ